MIELRSVQESDLDAFYEFEADPVASAMAAFPSRDRAAHGVHWKMKIMANPDNMARTVLVDGAVAGNVLSWSQDGVRYVGYWIGRDFWGGGVATAALSLLVRDIAERPLFADVVLANRGSQRVLEKNGFVLIEKRQSPEDGVVELVYRLD